MKTGEVGKLERALRALGENAKDATTMARAEVEQGRPYLARTAFLRLAWALVIDESEVRNGEPSWIEGWLRYARSTGKPQRGSNAALERILAKGVDPADLTDVVRQVEMTMLFNVCQLLDGEGVADLRAKVPELPEVDWRLYAIDADEKPTRPIESLHESWFNHDPTGRDGGSRSK